MEKDFVPYDRSLRLKALGFDWDCFASYNRENVLSYDHVNNNNLPYFAICSAPTFSQAFRWFREKYNLYSQLEYFHSPKWTYSILEFTDLKITPTKIALEYSKERTYEEAELACLDKLLEIVEGIESQK